MPVIQGGKNTSKQKNVIGDNVNKNSGGSGTIISTGGTTTTTAEVVTAMCIATSSIALGNTTTVIDGYTLLDGDIIAVQNQAIAVHNGIYEYSAAGNMVPVTDKISVINVKNGTTNALTTWARYSNFDTAANYQQVGGGSGAAAETFYCDGVYRHNFDLSGMIPTTPSTKFYLLVNQSPASENGLYVHAIGTDTYTLVANTYIYFQCKTSFDNANIEMWKKFGTTTYIHQNTSGGLVSTRARNNFISALNSSDPFLNRGEHGAFIDDGAYTIIDMNIFTNTILWDFTNTTDLKRLRSPQACVSAKSEIYETYWLKCVFAFEIENIDMQRGFTLTVVPDAVSSIVPTNSPLSIRVKGWNRQGYANYDAMEDYSFPIFKSRVGFGLENIIVEGTFFVQTTLDSANPGFIVWIDSGLSNFIVKENAQIDWRICNMKEMPFA